MHVKYNKENNTLSNRLSIFKKWGYRVPNPSKMVWVELGKWSCFSDLGLQDAQVPQHDRKMVSRCSPRPSKLSKNPPQNHCHHHERCWSSGSCIQYLNHHHNHCHHRNRWNRRCHKWPIGSLCFAASIFPIYPFLLAFFPPSSTSQHPCFPASHAIHLKHIHASRQASPTQTTRGRRNGVSFE